MPSTVLYRQFFTTMTTVGVTPTTGVLSTALGVNGIHFIVERVNTLAVDLGRIFTQVNILVSEMKGTS